MICIYVVKSHGEGNIQKPLFQDGSFPAAPGKEVGLGRGSVWPPLTVGWSGALSTGLRAAQEDPTSGDPILHRSQSWGTARLGCSHCARHLPAREGPGKGPSHGGGGERVCVIKGQGWEAAWRAKEAPIEPSGTHSSWLVLKRISAARGEEAARLRVERLTGCSAPNSFCCVCWRSAPPT